MLAIAGLCVHYGGTYDEAWPHPSADELAEDRSAYDGDAVLLIGEVTAVGTETLRLELETSAGETLEFEVRGADPAVEPGGVVQVYGPLAAGGTVQHAENVVVVNERAADRTYKLGVSAFAGVATAGLFLYYWRIDIRKLAFEVRHG